MRSKIPAFAAGLVLLGTGVAAADEYDDYVDTWSWYEPGLPSGIGVGLQLGAGVGGFTDHNLRASTAGGVNGLWNFRLAFGTHVPIAFEAAYVGEASNLNAIGAPNATLVGTTVEGDLRWNIMPHEFFTPYIFAGVGYQRYDVQNIQFQTADFGLRSSDNSMVIPMGLGLSYRDLSGFVVDARGTYRQSVGSNLVMDSTAGNPSLSWWEASLNLGYEF
jgi:hypothetical protein